MPPKTKQVSKFQTSSALFLTVDEEPMCFFLRPGPVKRKMQPLIKAGGGMLCNVQRPGAILLIDPEETTSIPETSAHWYVSTKYIHDCFDKNQRLNIEDYRLNPETTQKNPKGRHSKVGSSRLSGGRAAYTPEEDDAILSYVNKHMNDVGGNRLWQDMAKQQVTRHSWQSMKYRYRATLVHKLSERKQTEITPPEKEDKNQETDSSLAQSNEHRVSPQRISETENSENNSAEEDLTQIHPSLDCQDNAECPDDETCDLMETSKTEVNNTPEQVQPTQFHSHATISSEKDTLPETVTAEKPRVASSKDNASPKSDNQPITRQQMEVENMAYTKRLRSSPASSESSFKSLQFLSKRKTHSSPKKETRGEETPPNKLRRKIGVSVAEQVNENEQSALSEITQPDEVNCPAPPQQTQKKPEKRKLGILELATKEFEDDSEPESPDPQTQEETAPVPSTTKEQDKAALNSVRETPSTSNEQDPSPVQARQDPQPPSTRTSDPVVPEPATRNQPLANKEGLSKAHLFIFDSESQENDEEESQALVGHRSDLVQLQANGHKDAPLSLTQDQLQKDIQLITEFMRETNQDLVTVTKALLKTSGHFAAARQLLLNPSLFTGPVWTRTDDQRLCSANQEVRQELLTKYGEEGVAKRIMFLELEG